MIHASVLLMLLAAWSCSSASLPPASLVGTTCLNFLGQSVTLALPMLGDDYCDCFFTGQDEFNRTSACSHLSLPPHPLSSTSAFSASLPYSHHCPGSPPSTFSLFAQSSIPSSRVFDGVCDCCNGSDEPPGLCPDVCSSERASAVQYSSDVLRSALTGHSKYRESVSSASKMLAELNVLRDKLKKRAKEAEELAIVLSLYEANERSQRASTLPRADYALDSMRIKWRNKATADEKSKAKDAPQPLKGYNKGVVSSSAAPLDSLNSVLETKCPTANFTLDDYITVITAPLNHPNRYKARQLTADDTLIAPLLNDVPTLALRIVGTCIFGPIRAAHYVYFHAVHKRIWPEETRKGKAEKEKLTKGRELKAAYKQDERRKIEEVEDGEVEEEDEGENVDEEKQFRNTEEGATENDVFHPWSPMGLLLRLGGTYPQLDYRRYPFARSVVSRVRAGYGAVASPVQTMWDGPTDILSFAQVAVGAYYKDPDTHEYRLFAAAQTRLKAHTKEVEGQLAKVTEQLGTKYGPGNAFLPLAKTCVKGTFGKYEYSFCHMAGVKQGGTSLGTFSRWLPQPSSSSNVAAPHSYHFSRGAKCSGVTVIDTSGNNAVDVYRSGKVTFLCGESRIESVKESQTCVYDIFVRTHAVCDEMAVKTALRDLLGALQSQEEGTKIDDKVQEAVDEATKIAAVLEVEEKKPKGR